MVAVVFPRLRFFSFKWRKNKHSGETVDLHNIKISIVPIWNCCCRSLWRHLWRDCRCIYVSQCWIGFDVYSCAYKKKIFRTSLVLVDLYLGVSDNLFSVGWYILLTWEALYLAFWLCGIGRRISLMITDGTK
jgi:hypothetical protein